ncbi:MAG TPA: helical backbone metal receptor [Vicinamibacteria bacterium]|nr:helical backbone metal receptor [Vicinamibacteria bacterium]
MASAWLLAAAVVTRIVSLSPNVTEILDGIGAFDRVVAVSKFCEFPAEVEHLPRVGGWTDTSLEQVVALEPDLVIMADAQGPLIEEKLQALGLVTLVVKSQSLADIFDAIATIGDAVGNEKEARKLVETMRADLQEIHHRVEGRAPPRVLMVVDRLPGTLRDIYIATEGSYLTDLVRIGGGDPITPKAPHNYAGISAEALVSFDPEVIFDMVQALTIPVAGAGSIDLAEDPQSVWRTVSVRAVETGRVYPLSDKRLVHPSQFVVLAAREIAKRLHPEAFP